RTTEGGAREATATSYGRDTSRGMDLGSGGDKRSKSFPTRAALGAVVEADLADLVEHCLVADLEQARGLRPIPPDLLEDFLDHRLLGRHGRAARDVLEAELLLRSE